VEPTGTPVRAREEIAGGLRSLFHRPFSTLFLVGLLLSLVYAPISSQTSEAAGLSALVLLVLSVFVEIAIILAAGSDVSDPSADHWIKAAFTQRCFWRFLAAGIIATFAVGLGLIALVVGAFFLAGIVGLAIPAAVLERTGPIESIRRSSQLTKTARTTVAILFLIPLVPALINGIVVAVSSSNSLSEAELIVFSAASSALALAANVALARVFVKLGGVPVPGPRAKKGAWPNT
jgi:hypothetical protein